MVRTSCPFVTICSIQCLATPPYGSPFVFVITMQTIIISTAAYRRVCLEMPWRFAAFPAKPLHESRSPLTWSCDSLLHMILPSSMPISSMCLCLFMITSAATRRCLAPGTLTRCTIRHNRVSFDLEPTLHWSILICSQVTYAHICSHKYVSSSPNTSLLTYIQSFPSIPINSHIF
jgi:hypothetical protein